MLFELRTTKTLQEIDSGLRDAAARCRFGVLAVHDLKQTMRNKGVEFGGECLIYEVCQPHQAKRALEANPAVSAALPCRISVYRDDGGYRLSTILPTALMELFGTPALDPVAREVERDMQAIMQAAV